MKKVNQGPLTTVSICFKNINWSSEEAIKVFFTAYNQFYSIVQYANGEEPILSINSFLKVSFSLAQQIKNMKDFVSISDFPEILNPMKGEIGYIYNVRIIIEENCDK